MIAIEDLNSISRLFVSVFSNPPWNEHWEFEWASERLNWIYRSQGFEGYIAWDRDRYIGSIMGHFVPFRVKKGFQVVEFFVQCDRQNRGFGAKLLE